MKATQVIISLIFLGLYSTIALCQSGVILEEKPLVLPTYDVAPADKNPYFFTGRIYQGAQGHVYPYPMYDVLTDNRHDKTYGSVMLENQYTEVCVMPQLGGRILWARDKESNYDFFYRQHVVKPALIGMAGAWMSGGVEWNIPHHHRASSQLPVDYKLVVNEDGSKTVWVGETELRQRLRWTVGLTLYPDKSYIEATVKVFNNTPYIHSFLYWANVSVHCNKDYQVLFPPKTQFGMQHAKSQFVNWPIGMGIYGGTDKTGTDLSFWRNHPNPLSIFACNDDDDFLGGYDFGKDAGTIHVANHHVVNGKKFFLWGNNKEAEMWDKMLTEVDGDYLELMVGAFSNNQPDYSWIAPGETKVFKQYWYPAIKMGGLKAANKEGALNVERLSPGRMKIAFNTTSKVHNARIVVMDKDAVIMEKTIDIDPKNPYVSEMDVEKEALDENIHVALCYSDGRELVSYQKEKLKQEKLPEPVEIPRKPKDYKTIEELYNTGLRIEQFHNATLDPMDYYKEALSRDSMDSRVNTVIGIDIAKKARYTEAEKYLRRAVDRVTKNYTSPKDAESLYYLGIVLQHQKKYKEASDYLWKASWRKEFQTASFFALAQIACIKKDYGTALEVINSCVSTNTFNTEAIAMKCYILRKLNRKDEARIELSAILKTDVLNFHAVIEDQILSGDTISINGLKKLLPEMGNVPQTILELAVSYGDMGAYSDAISLLKAYIVEEKGASPMALYYLGYYKDRNGDSDALHYFSLASRQEGEYCFPFRIEELDILNKAIERNSNDAYAQCYIGNLYYFLDQKDKGIQHWEQAIRLKPQYSEALRNLGFAYGIKNELATAINYYEKAIRANSGDPLYFYELDVLYDKIQKPAKERLAFLEKYSKTVEKRDDATAQKVKLYIETGKYEQALQILQTRHFHVWEGGGDIHSVFVDACLLSGLQKMRNHNYSEALKDFETGSTYPDNLEVGESTSGGRNPEVYYMMGLAYESMGKTSEADSCFEKVTNYSIEKNSPLSYYQAMAYRKRNEEVEASRLLDELQQYAQKQVTDTGNIDFFSKFSEQTSSNKQKAEGYYLLGLAALGNGNITKANTEFMKALQLYHGHFWAKYYSSLKN